MEVGEVLVIGPNDERMSHPLQTVSPFLKGQHHRQEFSVPHVIVTFRRSEAAREEGAGVKLVVSG